MKSARELKWLEKVWQFGSLVLWSPFSSAKVGEIVVYGFMALMKRGLIKRALKCDEVSQITLLYVLCKVRLVGT